MGESNDFTEIFEACLSDIIKFDNSQIEQMDYLIDRNKQLANSMEKISMEKME